MLSVYKKGEKFGTETVSVETVLCMNKKVLILVCSSNEAIDWGSIHLILILRFFLFFFLLLFEVGKMLIRN